MDNDLEVKVAIMDTRLSRLEAVSNKMEDAMDRLILVSERQEYNTTRLTAILERVDKHEHAIEELLVSKAWVKGVVALASVLATSAGAILMFTIEKYIQV